MRPATVAEVAERLEVDREAARGLLTFLLAKNLAWRKGERLPEPGRAGGPAPLWIVDEDAPDALRLALRLLLAG